MNPENNPLKNHDEEEKPFVPKGAMAFFVLLILLLTALWFFVYFVSLSRIQ
ncbi:MAG: hypothetical protein H6579_06105 [Chitinophagales bacterium]|nr:hypothetical protein [Bacteroidota bacterium]MCB9256683.1 hypothetical protein [Chitinophagales bacterium]